MGSVDASFQHARDSRPFPRCSVFTAVYPNLPAKVLVDTGVYAYTRNPMYAGMTTAYLGGVLLTCSLWMVVLLPIMLLVIRTRVIAREGRHLTTQFPEAYAAYSARVRRWV